jgi:UDP-N-acetylmuramoyl-tripeptide--D-alanyl-D-alanine ligase
MNWENVLLTLLFTLPFFYKLSFWLYTIQLKEYRLDRFKEYIITPQGKQAVFNFWFLIEVPFFLICFSIFYNDLLSFIFIPVLFHFLLIENVFVLWKIFRKRVLIPQKTNRLLLTLLIITLIEIWLFYILVFKEYYDLIYFYILWNFIFIPLIIYISILISLPIVNFLKKRQINKAIGKSKHINTPVKIWITWSYWKSTVKEFLWSILEQHDKTLYTPENINTELWVSSLILKKLNNSFKYFIAEMWAYKIWEIETLWEIVNHKYWFLTAIWIQHLWLFWSQENIIKWKSEIYKKVLENKWKLYVNWDNNNIRKIKFKKNTIVKYWIKSGAEALSTITKTTNWKTYFTFTYKQEKIDFIVNLIWTHYIINLTWIIAFCLDIWIKKTNIKKYLKNLKLPKNTLEISIKNIHNHKVNIINDTYNLSKAGLFSWLELLNSFDKSLKVLIVDDILELWNTSEDIHYDIWKEIAEKNLADKVFYVWVNYKQSFIQWLLEWKFNKDNIINNIDIFKDNTTLLFEWRRARNYLNNLK